LYHVPAAVAGGTQSTTFDLTNTSAVTTPGGGTPQATVAGSAFGCSLIAKVSDGSGPVSGVGVRFTAIAAPGGAAATFSSIGGSEDTNPLIVNTDGTGTATVSAKSNAIAGSYDVTAGVPGTGQTATYHLTNLAAGDDLFEDGFEDPANT